MVAASGPGRAATAMQGDIQQYVTAVRDGGSFVVLVWLMVTWQRDLRPLLVRIEAALLRCMPAPPEGKS